MSIDFQTDKAIIMYYPSFAGGKFIGNCLSLSRHAVPQCREVANYLMENPMDYNYRLRAVLSTLPPKNEMQNWRQTWEFGDTEFYQGDFLNQVINWKQGKTTNTSTDILLSKLIEKNMHFFITAHGGSTVLVKPLVELWQNAKIVALINYSKFWNIAIKLKSTDAKRKLVEYAGNDCEEKYQILRGPDWPDWKIFKKCHYDVDKLEKYVTISNDIKEEMKLFYQWNQIKNQVFCLDVDNSYFDKTNFLDTMKQLYQWVGFDDYNPNLIEEYHRQYMMLHQD